MKALFTTLVLLFLLSFALAQECEDPDITVVTDCGTQFDLCLDDYTTGMGQAIVLNVTSNDDLGIFDPCDANAISSTANGTLDQFDENHPLYPCMYYYTPDQGFVGTDSFYYEMNFQDTCLFEQCVCDPAPGCTNGKIWTIKSMYIDTESGDVEVREKKNGTILATFVNLEFGDEFFVDGSGLGVNQTEWIYKQTKNGVVEEQQVHTSCSQQIFGEIFGYFRVISGCIAPSNQQSLCTGVGAFSGSENRAAGDPITTETADTTIVRITIEPLAIDFLYLRALRSDDEVNLTWDHLMSTIPGSLEIQRSVGNGEFVTIGQFSGDDVAERRSFADTDAKEGFLYYRLKAVDYDGKFTYSRVASVAYKSSDKEIVTIFPNPGKGNFNVQWNVDEQQYEWKIYDNLSRMVGQSSTTSQADLESQLNSLPQGLYIVSINDTRAENQIKRVVVY